MGKLFGTDGVRGPVYQYPLTEKTVEQIGFAVAGFFRKASHHPRILIGMDTRISGPVFEKALVSGIRASGGDALLAGVIPTPGIAYLTRSLQADAGIVISASHNPFSDNGIKIFSGDGFKLPDETESKIETMIAAAEVINGSPSNKPQNGKIPLPDAGEQYKDFLKRIFPSDLSLKGMKLVLDCANGATYRIAPETFRALGADVVSFSDRPDGKNINDNCGSQHPEHIASEVARRGAVAGFAFDGDGDRVIAVDEKGNILTGDRTMVICANAMKKRGCLANNVVVTTIMSNLGLRIALKDLGIDSRITAVGDRYVLDEMRRSGASIGGEDSGHLIFMEKNTTGDGILTALQLLEAKLESGKSLSELAGIMTVFPQRLTNIAVRSKPDISTVPAIVEAIAEAEAALGDRGRVLVRYSGTENLCRVMVEGPTDEETERHSRQIADAIRKSLA
jgi:phosphoglucosamine mutase